MIRVKKITIKEFKKLQNLEKVIDGDNIIISGENGVGKSSVMQFIEIALGKSTNIPPGATGEGVVVADKDGNEYSFHVKFDKNNKAVLTITTPDGLSDSRKGTIAAIVGAINFDIHEFVEQSKSEKGRKEQVEIFKNLLPEDIRNEVNKLEANVEVNYKKRTEINKEIKDLKGFISEHDLIKKGIPLESFKPVDVSAENDKYTAALNHNNILSGIEARMKEREENIKKAQADIEKKQQELADAIDAHEKLVTQQEGAVKHLQENRPIDTNILKTTIQNATQANENYRQAQDLVKKQKELEAKEELSGSATAMIESERQLISDFIKDASNPVPGLAFDSDGLLYNGIPVSPDSLSFSEIIELGIKMKIAENPNLPLFISNGESIGLARLNEIKEIAKRSNLQIIMEQVERGQETLKIEVMS